MLDQIKRFAIAGFAGFIVDAGLLSLAIEFGLGYFAGRAISFLSAVFVTWQINRRITFSKAHRPKSLWVEWRRYFLAMSAGGGINYAVYSSIVLMLKPAFWVPTFAVAVGSVAGMTVNFAMSKWWVFKHKNQYNHMDQ